MSLSPIVPDPSSQEGQPDKLVRDRRLRWFEVFLVILVAVGNHVLASVHSSLQTAGDAAAQALTSVEYLTGILHEAAALFLLGYVLSRSGRRFRDLGLKWSLRDAAAGLPIAGVASLSYWVGAAVAQWLDSAIRTPLVAGEPVEAIFGNPSVLAVPYYLLSPFFEELIVRAYLMTEIKELTKSATLAVAVSVFIQASYHLYQGWAEAISLGFLFLVFALYYARWQRAFPIIVAHGLLDLNALFQLW